MSKYHELLDAVNESKTEADNTKAYYRLDGWRTCLDHLMIDWSGTDDDRYTAAKYGENRPVCCGVLLDWEPTERATQQQKPQRTDMDIKTLEALGISAETLCDRIVDQAVEALLSSSGFDPDSEQELRYVSRFKKEIEARIQKAVDEKIAALAAVHLIPRVGEMIESADMRQTNKYGEPTSPPMTFKEYIASRAESYMSEEVNLSGESKAEVRDSYNWKSCGPRLNVLMKNYIKDSMETAAKSAVNDINKAIAKNIEKAAREAIASAAGAIKVAVSVAP